MQLTSNVVHKFCYDITDILFWNEANWTKQMTSSMLILANVGLRRVHIPATAYIIKEKVLRTKYLKTIEH